VEDARFARPAGRDPMRCEAAIAALHARAPSYRDTDWPQIAGLYEVLLRISPSPVVELNHAAAACRWSRTGAGAGSDRRAGSPRRIKTATS